MSEGLNRDEFFDVYRQFKPDADREEYEREGEVFQALKAKHLAMKQVQ